MGRNYYDMDSWDMRDLSEGSIAAAIRDLFEREPTRKDFEVVAAMVRLFLTKLLVFSKIAAGRLRASTRAR